MSDPLGPHRALVTLAEAACAHVEAERWDELAATQEEFGRRLAEVHGPQSADAEELLRRALALHVQATRALQERRANLITELGLVRVGRDAASGYMPGVMAPDGAVDHAA